MPGPRKAKPSPQAATGAPIAFESEQAVLGAIVLDGTLAEVAINDLTQADFYSPSHQAVFLAVGSILADGLQPNAVTVAERAGVPRPDVSELLDKRQPVSEPVLRTLCSDIRKVARLRSFYNACTNAAANCTKDADLDSLADQVQKDIYSEGGTAKSEAKDGSTVLEQVKASLLERRKGTGEPIVSSGMRSVDSLLIGVRPKLWVVAGRPSMGKTAFADTIRRNVNSQGHGVITFSLEMDAEELLERELAYAAELNLRKVITGQDVSDEEVGRVNAASLNPDLWRIVDDTYTMAAIVRKTKVIAKQMERKGIKLKLVIIDYLQLMAGQATTDGSMKHVIDDASRKSKLLSKELGICVMALSQLNRNCEYREDKRPMMADLRDTGAIEQDADIISFVYRHHIYDMAYSPEDAELIVRKQRGGPQGIVKLKYVSRLVYFKDLDTPLVKTANVPDVQELAGASEGNINSGKLQA